MNSLRTRGAFTLRDLLMLMSVVGFALTLILSCINSVRHDIGGRRTVCANNMRNVGFAMVCYEEARGHYPGWHESIFDGNGARFSRPMVYEILPQLERNDIYERYDAQLHPQDGMPPFDMDVLWCPSSEMARNRAQPSAACSYVFNCGMPDDPSATPGDWPANGVFHSHYRTGVPYNKGDLVFFGSTFIQRNDGLSSTIMVSENLDAGPWTDVTELSRGFVWSPLYEGQDFARINSGRKGEYRGTPHANARVSSNHNGIVNVYFCDGHIQPISDDINYRVFAQLMTPAGGEAAWPGRWIGIKIPIADGFRNRWVDDSDY